MEHTESFKFIFEGNGSVFVDIRYLMELYELRCKYHQNATPDDDLLNDLIELKETIKCN